jgi:hypothetical protein
MRGTRIRVRGKSRNPVDCLNSYTQLPQVLLHEHVIIANTLVVSELTNAGSPLGQRTKLVASAMN